MLVGGVLKALKTFVPFTVVVTIATFYSISVRFEAQSYLNTKVMLFKQFNTINNLIFYYTAIIQEEIQLGIQNFENDQGEGIRDLYAG